MITLDKKFRPAVFDDVCGQESSIDILKILVLKKLYRAAYMFEGPSGTGKTTCGRIFAKAILCYSPINGNPCNKCESCFLFEREQHFGYREHDAASVGGKDDMVRLRDEAYSIPVSGKKIILIDECQDITNQGQDALLKQVEECPGHLIYLFCTTEREKMKKTLQDRCVEISFSKVNSALILQRLRLICEKEGIEYEEGALSILADCSEGHVRNAIKNLEKVSYLGPITENSVKMVYKNYDEEILTLLLFLGKDLKKVMDMYKKVSMNLSSMEFYNRVLSLVNEGSNYVCGYDSFSKKRREMLQSLKEAHGYGLLEFLKYLIEHDRFINIQSDLLVLHYKFCSNSFVPKTVSSVSESNLQVSQISSQKESVPVLSYNELSKKSIKERCELLRKQRANQKTEQVKETENIPDQWPLPKEERFGEDSLDEDVLSPQDFSKNLVGGRGGTL